MRRLARAHSVVVASDDHSVQAAAIKISGVRAVCFTERMESFYAVAEDVLLVLESINAWMATLDPLMPKALLSWGQNVEGGYTAQRVQDSLLLIRSYLDLIDVHPNSPIHLIVDPRAKWEDCVLRSCAHSRHRIVISHHVSLTGEFIEKSRMLLRPYAIAFYHTLNVLRLGGGRLRRATMRPTVDGAVIFQLCSSRKAHIDNVRSLMTALSAKGYLPVALCWSASDRASVKTASSQLNRDGFKTVELESHVTLVDLAESFFLPIRAGLRARFHKTPWAFHYRGVSLSSVLDYSFTMFGVAILPQRIRYLGALNSVLINSTPIAFKPWGGPESFEGKEATRILLQHGRPLIFHYWLGGALDWPYADSGTVLDLFLAKGAYEAALATTEYRLKADQVVVVGNSRFTQYSHFAAHISRAESRNKLKLPLGAPCYIGVDLNIVLRGYFSKREQIDLITAMIDVARRRPNIVVIFKPHPGYPIDHSHPIFSERTLANVFVLSRLSPVDHFLNSVDIVVTKFSTLILEAALFKRGIIAAIFDGEQRFKEFGDIPEVVDCAQQLEDLLLELTAVEHRLEEWLQLQNLRHTNLLPAFCFSSATPSAEMAANALLAKLPSAIDSP